MKKSATKVNLNDDPNHQISVSLREVHPNSSRAMTSTPCVFQDPKKEEVDAIPLLYQQIYSILDIAFTLRGCIWPEFDLNYRESTSSQPFGD